MEKRVTVEELLEKVKKPAKEAMRLHPFYKGKVQIMPKCAIRNFDDFAIWYTPGVAEPCKDIKEITGKECRKDTIWPEDVQNVPPIKVVKRKIVVPEKTRLCLTRKPM